MASPTLTLILLATAVTATASLTPTLMDTALHPLPSPCWSQHYFPYHHLHGYRTATPNCRSTASPTSILLATTLPTLLSLCWQQHLLPQPSPCWPQQ